MSEPAAKGNSIQITDDGSKSLDRVKAELAFSSYATNTLTTKIFTDNFGDLAFLDCMNVMELRQEEVRGGNLSLLENLMTAQAITLNALFNKLAQRAGSNMGEYMSAADTYMRLALKAQSQCAKTVEVLASIKNPPSVAFVKQANIGNAVQVNNGQQYPNRTRTHAQAHGENPKPANELLEAQDGERLDTRTTATSGAIDSGVETVAARHRAD